MPTGHHQEGQAAGWGWLACWPVSSWALWWVDAGPEQRKTFPLGDNGNLQGLAWKSIFIITSYLEKMVMLAVFVIHVTENKAQPTSLRLGGGIQKRGCTEGRSRGLRDFQKEEGV